MRSQQLLHWLLIPELEHGAFADASHSWGQVHCTIHSQTHFQETPVCYAEATQTHTTLDQEEFHI